MKTTCYYHGNCFDGMAAAWVVYKNIPDAKFIPANYGDARIMNDLQQDCYENAIINDRIILVDFSFPRDLMKQISNKAKEFIVLDHHKTAQEACAGLKFCIFDMDKSGASLAWEYFHPFKKVPRLISYIEDRDLWRFKLPNSASINAFIQSYEMTFENYNYLETYLEVGYNDAILAGEAIERYKNSMVKAMIKNPLIVKIGNHMVPVVNATSLFSEVGHALCKAHPSYPFAASYYHRNDGVTQYSLRSIGDFDVSAIAWMYGGGGHKNAAGFQVDYRL